MRVSSATLATLLRHALAEIEAGRLVPVAFTLGDNDAFELSFRLLADALPPVAGAGDRTCPRCGTAGTAREAGKTPGAQPPTLDLLCVGCQHVWQIPLED